MADDSEEEVMDFGHYRGAREYKKKSDYWKTGSDRKKVRIIRDYRDNRLDYELTGIRAKELFDMGLLRWDTVNNCYMHPVNGMSPKLF